MSIHSTRLPTRLRAVGLLAVLLLAAACARAPEPEPASGLDPYLVTRAIDAAHDLRASGSRVWCVPFARNASGIQIRGDAHTWWSQAKGLYPRGKHPSPGAAMAFAATGKLPLGHIAVVSRVVSDREVLIHHANWHRNQVSLDMSEIDVSRLGDWSEVRVESNPGAYGSV